MLKVVIVDDEALVRLGLQSMLRWEELGYEIVGEATNGQQGLDLIMQSDPDIVITDIKMPVMDGLEMMRLAAEAGRNPRFIVLSGYDEFQLVKRAMKLGAEEYLIKLDLEPNTLAEALLQRESRLWHSATGPLTRNSSQMQSAATCISSARAFSGRSSQDRTGARPS